MQSDKAHAPGTISGKALHSHICHYIAAVLDIGGFPERRVGTAYIVVVTSQHDRTYFAPAYHFIETQCDIHTAQRVLIQNACLGPYHQVILFGVANPYPVVHILSAAIFRDTLHSGTVGLYQIFLFPAQAYPAEGAVTIIEKLRPHDILYIRRPDESILLVCSIA